MSATGATLAASTPVAGESELTYEFSPDLVTLTDARPAEAEAIRTIRTHVVARHLEDGRRGLAVCGPTAGVGCSFTAVNLAVALAQVGVATLLIDADLRAPSLTSFIRPSVSRGGLTDCISSTDRLLSDVVHPEVLPNLSLLYAGAATGNPQEMLSGEGFKTLVERCLRDFEFTIIDTSPVTLGADALRVSRIIGYALVVAKANVTKVSDLSHMAHALQEDGAKVIGTVLNEL